MQENIEKKTIQSKLVESSIKVIGDKSTVCEVIQLLAYIRHAIKNKEQIKIEVNVGSKVNSDFFGFQVNEQEIKDYISQEYIEIN